MVYRINKSHLILFLINISNATPSQILNPDKERYEMIELPRDEHATLRKKLCSLNIDVTQGEIIRLNEIIRTIDEIKENDEEKVVLYFMYVRSFNPIFCDTHKSVYLDRLDSLIKLSIDVNLSLQDMKNVKNILEEMRFYRY